MKKHMRKIIVAAFILVLLAIGMISLSNFYTEEYIENEINININQAYIYGQNLNINGTYKFESEKNELKKLTLVLNKEEYTLDFKINDENEVSFTTDNSDINKRIFLDNIKPGEYKLHLKEETSDGTTNLYRITSDYEEEFEYYTITKNKKNNRITIEFDNEIKFNIQKKNLPSDYYDIVIDPGHGGAKQPGAVYKDIIEKEYTLKISLLVKERLEKLGYKVLLTREKDEVVGENDPYGEDGRIAFAYKSKAKYFFSIHLNSHEATESGSGVEIYSPTNVDYELASSLASNIKTLAKTEYSINIKNKITDGVYVRTFGDEDISYLHELADKNNYNHYNIDTNTQYYFVIRETGGVASGAYRDGRDGKAYNNYYNSTIGAEGYLVELGYIPNKNDYKNILNNYEEYAKGVATGIDNYFKEMSK